MHKISMSAALICIMALSACNLNPGNGGNSGGGGVNNGPSYSPQISSTQNSGAAYATIQLGSFRVENNEWNSGAATGSYSQGIFSDATGKTFGWTWNWPLSDSSVVAYPEVGYGYSPWGGGSWGTPSGIPVQISAGKTITANFNILSSHTGKYDLAFDIWVTATSSPSSADIRYEIMIWLDHSGFNPAGKLVATGINISGTVFDAWTNDNMASGTSESWTYIAYVAESPLYNGSIDISGIFKDMINKWGVSSSLYIASIEFGNEVMGGTGTTTIQNWNLTIQ